MDKRTFKSLRVVALAARPTETKFDINGKMFEVPRDYSPDELAAAQGVLTRMSGLEVAELLATYYTQDSRLPIFERTR